MTRASREYSPPSTFSPHWGAGGLAVTFFMWMMFWVPHPGQPVPIFEDNWAIPDRRFPSAAGHGSWRHGGHRRVRPISTFKLLVFNLRSFAAFRRSDKVPGLRAIPTPAARFWPCRSRSP